MVLIHAYCICDTFCPYCDGSCLFSRSCVYFQCFCFVNHIIVSPLSIRQVRNLSPSPFRLCIHQNFLLIPQRLAPWNVSVYECYVKMTNVVALYLSEVPAYFLSHYFTLCYVCWCVCSCIPFQPTELHFLWPLSNCFDHFWPLLSSDPVFELF